MVKIIKPISDYTKNVLTVMSGTVISQVILITISPILTRVYSPKDFGIFALYMAFVNIFSTISTGRYELAILLPKNNITAAHIVIMTVTITFFLSLTFAIILIFLQGYLPYDSMVVDIRIWLYLLPLSIFLTGSIQTLTYWLNRGKKYRKISTNKILQSISISLVTVIYGLTIPGPYGLYIGFFVGSMLSILYLIMQFSPDYPRSNIKIKILLARKYINFPKYLMAAHSLNRVSVQIPIIFLYSLFGPVTSGLLSLTQRVVSSPTSIIAGAITTVFRQRASYNYSNYRKFDSLYRATFIRLFALALPLFSLFYYIAPELFSVIFGEEWRRAGVYARILTPFFFIRFVFSPFNPIFMITGRQRYELIWQISLILVVIMSFIVGGYYYDSVIIALVLYSIVSSLLFIVNGALTYKLSKG